MEYNTRTFFACLSAFLLLQCITLKSIEPIKHEKHSNTSWSQAAMGGITTGTAQFVTHMLIKPIFFGLSYVFPSVADQTYKELAKQAALLAVLTTIGLRYRKQYMKILTHEKNIDRLNFVAAVTAIGINSQNYIGKFINAGVMWGLQSLITSSETEPTNKSETDNQLIKNDNYNEYKTITDMRG